MRVEKLMPTDVEKIEGKNVLLTIQGKEKTIQEMLGAKDEEQVLVTLSFDNSLYTIFDKAKNISSFISQNLKYHGKILCMIGEETLCFKNS